MIHPRRAQQRTQRAVQAAHISFTIGAFDFSFNEEGVETERVVAPRRIVTVLPKARLTTHVWAFAPADRVHRGRGILGQQFRSTRSVPRPLKVYGYDGAIQALAYAYKTDFSRRVTIPMRVSSRGRTLSRRNTRHRPLRSGQRVELMLLLDDLGLAGRLILHGVRIVTTVNGPSIVEA